MTYNFFDYFINYYLHHAFGTTYIITEVICSLAVALSFSPLKFKSLKSLTRLLIDWASSFVLYLFISCFSYYIFEISGNVDKSNTMMFFTYAIVCILHIPFCYNIGSLAARMTLAISTTLFVVASIILSGCIGSYITTSNGAPSSIFTDFTLYIILILLLLIIVLTKLFSPYKFKYIKLTSTILINLAFLLSYILIILILLFADKEQLFTSFLVIGILILVMISYAIFYINVKNYNTLLDYQAQTLKVESEKSQLEISNLQYDELHKIRHDIKNQMSILSELVKNKQYDELNKYFADLNELVHISIDYIDCGNMVVNAVLNMELSKAKARNLTINYGILVPNELSQIQPQDLTSLVTNLLDNAIEYSINNNIDTPIEFSLNYRNNCLLVKCKNKLSDKDINSKLNLKSHKSEILKHGYGTKIITSICRKYNGVAKFKKDNDYFVFEGMMTF